VCVSQASPIAKTNICRRGKYLILVQCTQIWLIWNRHFSFLLYYCQLKMIASDKESSFLRKSFANTRVCLKRLIVILIVFKYLIAYWTSDLAIVVCICKYFQSSLCQTDPSLFYPNNYMHLQFLHKSCSTQTNIHHKIKLLLKWLGQTTTERRMTP